MANLGFLPVAQSIALIPKQAFGSGGAAAGAGIGSAVCPLAFRCCSKDPPW